MIFSDKQKLNQQQTKLDNLIQKVKDSNSSLKSDLKKLEQELDEINKVEYKDDVTSSELDKLKKSLGEGGQSKTVLFLFFAVFFAFIPLLYFSSPVMSTLDKKNFYIYPSNPKDLMQINEVVQKYSQQNFYFVLICFTYLYLFLQSFCIPGPIILSLIGGALYGRFWGFLLVTFCCSVGSSICYTISYYLARGIIVSKFPTQILWFKKIVFIQLFHKFLSYFNKLYQQLEQTNIFHFITYLYHVLNNLFKQLEENKDNLIFQVIFLRLTPFLPNWLINSGSPIIGLKFHTFFLGTFIGLMPANIIHTYTGSMIQNMEKIGLSIENVLFLILLGFVVLIPTLFTKQSSALNKKS